MLLHSTQAGSVNLQVADAKPASDANLRKQSYPEEENGAKDIHAASDQMELQADGAQDMKHATDSQVPVSSDGWTKYDSLVFLSVHSPDFAFTVI